MSFEYTTHQLDNGHWVIMARQGPRWGWHETPDVGGDGKARRYNSEEAAKRRVEQLKRGDH